MGSTKNILFLIFFILFFHSYKAFMNSSSTLGCIESEREALLKSKASLANESGADSVPFLTNNPIGPNIDLSSWKGRDCCSWYGITCDNLTGHVQALQLVGNRDQQYLNSRLSPWLFNLTHLKVLSLVYCGLVSPIPNMFDKLTSLTYLDLSYNSLLDSPLPLSIFNLTRLELLKWSQSDLMGPIPDMFDKLTSLTTLDLSNNYINSFMPPSLFNLTQLEILNMSNTVILGPMPSMFDRLTSLVHLDLSWNSCNHSMFLSSLCNLTSLTVMQLSYSSLQGSLPSCLANLTSLTSLQLRGNKLSGEIPGELGNLTRLITLDLSGNHFNSSIPSTFGNLHDLLSLNLAGNHLSGVIPSNLRNLIKLEQLYVDSNFLTGELSEFFFERYKSLKELGVSRNRYFGLNVSPQWIPPFQMSIILTDSVFIGTQFPPWLQTQWNLENLYMSNASISGAIPNWCLTAFPNLTALDLSNNLLTGSVPALNYANLTSIQLSGNKLSGKIPQQLCNLKYLQSLTLANNQLVGIIPPCLGALQNLIVLDFGNNRLSGHIPYELGSLNRLWALHLNGNKLSGELPRSWEFFDLITLDLGDNELQGHIPKWIGNGYGFNYVRLESNKFSGVIPISLCYSSRLYILNLARNNLVGTIPSCLGNLSMKLSDVDGTSGYGGDGFDYAEAILNINKGREMLYTSSLRYAKFISLSGNRLHGEIPVELMNLEGLNSLDLSRNDLNGTIPETINNLKQLESLDLSMNRLSGKIPQSLAEIDRLSYLNLSFNNFDGKIPSGNHFDTLDDPSIYEGNMGLCGNKLLMKSCPGDVSSTFNQPNGPISDNDDEFDRISWMYAGIGPGFAVGFLAIICTLYFRHSWRIAYFGFVDNVYNKAVVTFTIRMSHLRTKFS